MPRTAGSSQYEVRVEREELLRYLAVLSKSITSKDKVARISFDDGWLMIAVGEADFAIAAEGKWAKPVSIDASWIQKMNRLLPAGNPLVLRVEKKHFYINSFGVPCHEVAKKKAPAPSNVEPSRETLRSIGQAAKLLEPFHVTAQDVIELVKKAQSVGPPSWTTEATKLIATVAKAWIVLAPLGVETSDLRSLIDNAVRNAFTRKSK
jgi:hypothetical protein